MFLKGIEKSIKETCLSSLKTVALEARHETEKEMKPWIDHTTCQAATTQYKKEILIIKDECKRITAAHDDVLTNGCSRSNVVACFKIGSDDVG